MRNILTIALLLCMCIPLHSYQQVKQEFQEPVKPKKFNENEDTVTSPKKAFFRRAFSDLTPVNQKRSSKGDANGSFSVENTAGLTWKEAGPFDMSGRTLSIIHAPSAAYPYRAYATSSTAGIFKTLDYRLGNWKICGETDKLAEGTFCSIVQDRNDPEHLYACSGLLIEWDAQARPGMGIYESVDGGDSWSLLSYTQGIYEYPSKMVMGLNNDLFVAAIPKTSLSLGGVFRVDLQGQSMNPVSPVSTAYDLAVGANGDIWFTTNHKSPLISQPACGVGAVYVSRYKLWTTATGDNGTWEDVTPDAAAGNIDYGSFPTASNSCSYFHLVALTEKDENSVYLRSVISLDNNTQQYILYSDDAGNRWKLQSISPEPAQTFYNTSIAADQSDQSVVYCGSKNAFKSYDNGVSWTSITTPYPDKNLAKATSAEGQFFPRHFLANLRQPGESVFTNDGGVFYATGNTSGAGLTSFRQVNGGYNNSFYFRMDLHPYAGRNEWLGAALDNGIHFVTPEGTILEVTDDRNGTSCHYDKSNPDVQFLRFNDDPNYYMKDGNSIVASVPYSAAINWHDTDPSDYDSDDKLLYAIGETGHYGQVDFNNSTAAQIALDNFPYANEYSVSCVKVDPNDDHVIWLGVYHPNDVARLIRVDDAHTPYPQYTDFQQFYSMPNGTLVKSISFRGSNQMMALGFANTPNDRVWLYDANVGWSSIEGDLPAERIVHDVLWVDAQTSGSGYYIYTATDAGLWFTDQDNAGSTSWQIEDELPNADVRNICYREADNTLAVSTYGHGVFTSKDINGAVADADFTSTNFTPTVNEIISFQNLSHGGTTFHWNFGDGTTSTVENPAAKAYQGTGIYKVTLTVNGNLVVSKNIDVQTNSYGFSGYQMKWTEMGPFDNGCRVNHIAYAPTSTYPRRAFASANAGGIYRTNDYRYGNWKICGNSGNLAEGGFGSVIQDPNNANKLYALSGFTDAELVQGSKRSRGIFVSTNGGDTWSHLSYTDNHFIYPYGMVLGKNNDLFVSALGVSSASEGGVFRISLNNQTVTRVLDLKTGYDIATNSNGDIWVTSNHKSPLLTSQEYCNDQKVFVSRYSTHGTNTGKVNTWVNVTPTLANISSWGSTSVPSSLCHYWVRIATTTADPNRVYLHTASTSGASILRSEDGGNTWLWLGLRPPYLPWLFPGTMTQTSFKADEVNPDVLYMGGIEEYKSIDKGTSYSQLSSTTTIYGYQKTSGYKGHVDSKFFLPNLYQPGESLFANDGGIFYSNDNLSTQSYPTFTQANSGYNTTMYYNIDLHPQSNKIEWVGGTQDNGGLFTGSAGTYADLIGDGFQSYYDKDDPSTSIYNIGNGYSFHKRTGNISSAVYFYPGYVWNVFDWDSQNDLIYCGGNPGNYAKISFTGSTVSQVSIPVTNPSLYRVSFVKVDPVANNTIWVALSGMSNGAGVQPKLYRIQNANTATPSFTDRTPSGFPMNGWLNHISFDASNDNRMAVCFSNKGIPRIWTSDDKGVSWTNFDGYLPADLNVNCVMRVPNINSATGSMILAGTNKGLWVATDLAGATTYWQVSEDLAWAEVRWLCYRASDATAAAGNYYNGVWMTKDFGSSSVAPSFSLSKHVVCGSEAISFFNTSFGGYPASWNFGDGTTSTATNPPPHTYANPGTYTVSLTVAGQTITKTVNVLAGNIAITKPVNTNVLVNQNVNFEFQTCLNYSFLTWDFGDGTTSNLLNPVKAYSNPGTYTVTVTLDNYPPFQATITINVAAGGRYALNSNTAPKTKGVTRGNWTISPNPTKGLLHITGPAGLKDVVIKLTDLSGKILMARHTSFGGRTMLHIPGTIQRGVYMVSIITGSDILHTSKIILAR